ncbi:hypothetical protein GCM10009566_58280 [Streptomyces murinus]|nr:hypothetical protein SRO_5668 [Streptomyces rochei]
MPETTPGEFTAAPPASLWAEARPAPAASRPPATIVTAAAFFRFFTFKPLLDVHHGGSPWHALENGGDRPGMRHPGDIPTTV